MTRRDKNCRTYLQRICSWPPETFLICSDMVRCARVRRQECELDIAFVRSTWHPTDRWRQWSIQRSVRPDWSQPPQPWHICRHDDVRRSPFLSRSLRSSSTPAQMSPADRIRQSVLRFHKHGEIMAQMFPLYKVLGDFRHLIYVSKTSSWEIIRAYY